MKGLENRILLMFGDENLSNEMGKSARKKVTEKFTFKKLVDRIERAYKKIQIE